MLKELDGTMLREGAAAFHLLHMYPDMTRSFEDHCGKGSR